MLEAMRRGAQTWVAKILFGLLVASFAVWGVADVFRGWGAGSIASIGDTQISREEFQREFNKELDMFSREAEKRLTPDQGRALGLDRRVLSQLLGGAAIEQHAKLLGLNLSDATLVEALQNDPNLKDANGNFSREAFFARARQMGLSEQGFLNLFRKDELRTQVIGSLVKGLAVPKAALEVRHAYDEEKRTIEWIAIDADKVVKVADPDEAKVKEKYEASKARYMTPEYRKFQMLELSADALKSQVPVTDEEIEKSYAMTKDSYDTPEQRRVQQIAFKDKASAEAALKALRDGSKSFGDVAKDAGAKDTDVDLGLIAKKALIDPTIADAAFKLEKDKFSDVIEGRFATVITRVTQIEPGVFKTLADVKDQVRNKLATEKARGLLQKKHDEIDDLKSAGKTLKEIADQTKLPYQEIAAADRNGLAPDGKPVIATTDGTKIIADVFAPDANTLDQGVELPSGAIAWLNVIGTEAPKQKPFEDVKDSVKADLIAAERAKQVSEIANKLVERLNAGEAMSALEAAAGGKAEKSEPVTRKTVPQGLTEGAVAQAFVLAEGKAGSAETSDRGSRLVFKVTGITPAPAATKEQLDKIAQALQGDYTSQVLNEYAETLKSRLGATINETELKRAFGSSDQ